MSNIVSETGFWIENEDEEHMFIQELSNEIKRYAKIHKIKTVYDFGCGTGAYLKDLTDSMEDISATGFEGHQVEVLFSNVKKADLSEPIQLEPADLVISIEVGEHIPEKFENTFIGNLCNNGKSHMFLSWAVEGQYGLGHVNCKNNDYIIKKISDSGWKFNEEETARVRSNMPDIWIKNTLMIFNK